MAAPAISFSIEREDQILAMYREKQEAVLIALLRQMDLEHTKLARYIVTEKLSGQVLKRVTGTLADSVHMLPAAQEGTVIEGGVASSGGPAWYGHVHEYGGAKSYEIVPVNKQALAFVIGGKQVFAKRVLHPPLPQRAFMAPSLEENRAAILANLQGAIGRVVATPSRAA